MGEGPAGAPEQPPCGSRAGAIFSFWCPAASSSHENSSPNKQIVCILFFIFCIVSCFGTSGVGVLTDPGGDCPAQANATRGTRLRIKMDRGDTTVRPAGQPGSETDGHGRWQGCGEQEPSDEAG